MSSHLQTRVNYRKKRPRKVLKPSVPRGRGWGWAGEGSSADSCCVQAAWTAPPVLPSSCPATLAVTSSHPAILALPSLSCRPPALPFLLCHPCHTVLAMPSCLASHRSYLPYHVLGVPSRIRPTSLPPRAGALGSSGKGTTNPQK